MKSSQYSRIGVSNTKNKNRNHLRTIARGFHATIQATKTMIIRIVDLIISYAIVLFGIPDGKVCFVNQVDADRSCVPILSHWADFVRLYRIVTFDFSS